MITEQNLSRWREAVAAGETTLGVEKWIDEANREDAREVILTELKNLGSRNLAEAILNTVLRNRISPAERMIEDAGVWGYLARAKGER